MIGGVSAGGMDVQAMRAQIEQLRGQRFAAADTDGSGGLSLQEFEAAASANPVTQAKFAGGANGAAAFARLDADGDGSVTMAELPAGRLKSMGPGAFGPGAMSTLLGLQEIADGTSRATALQSIDPLDSLFAATDEDDS